MQNYEIIDMLKERQLAASGFYEDNKKMLQKVLDEEYERDVKKMAEFNAEFWESRARETAMLQDIRRAQRNQMAEDQVVANAPKIRNWLKAVEAGTCGSHKSLNNCKKTLIRYVLRTLPRECSTLVSLDICWCEIDDSTAQMVGALIGSNNYLKVLDLSHNDIGSAGLQEIAKGVQRNDTLHSLTLDHNPVMKDEAGATSMLGIDALCEAVRLSPKLQRLNLLMTGVTKDAGAAIVTACQYSDTLLIVNVPLHAMTLQVQEQLAEKLSENRQLRDQAKRDERARRLEEAKEARDRELQAAKEREKNKAEQWVRDQAERRLMERRKQAWDELQRRTELQSAQIVEKHVAMLQALQGGTGKKKKKRRKKRKGKRKARKKKK